MQTTFKYMSFRPEELKKAITKLNQDLEGVHKWSVSNSALINAKKTKFIVHEIKNQT